MRLRLEKVELRLRLENETVRVQIETKKVKVRQWETPPMWLFSVLFTMTANVSFGKQGPRAEIKKHLKLLLSLAPLRASWQQHSSSEQQLHVMIESRWPSKRPRPSKNEEAESKIEDELWMWFWSEDDVKCKNQTS